MKKLIVDFLFIACLFMPSCSNENEPIAFANILGTWTVKYPEGLQTEGFVTWSFNSKGELIIYSCDAFAGDHTSMYDYTISEENNSILISGNLKISDREIIHDTFASYEVVKLSKNELQIKQSWVNDDYADFAPEDKNVFLLGGYKEVSFKRNSQNDK